MVTCLQSTTNLQSGPSQRRTSQLLLLFINSLKEIMEEKKPRAKSESEEDASLLQASAGISPRAGIRTTATATKSMAAVAGIPRQRDDSSTVIEDWDVVLGRGSYNTWRPGNARLLSLVDEFMTAYDNAADRKSKTKIIQTIYDDLTSRGRFLGRGKSKDEYHEVSENFAKKKISHTFRDRRRKERQSTSVSMEEELIKNQQSPAPSDDEKPPAIALAKIARQSRTNSVRDGRTHADSSVVTNNIENKKEDDEKSIASSGSSLFTDEELLSVSGRRTDYK